MGIWKKTYSNMRYMVLIYNIYTNDIIYIYVYIYVHVIIMG